MATSTAVDGEQSSATLSAQSNLTARHSAAAVGLLGLVLASLIAGLWFASAPEPTDFERHPERLAGIYDPPRTSLELALVQGDGQLFASQASDPFLRQPELIRGGPSGQAYRLQRPLYGWAGWVASLGQPGAIPPALIAITIAATGALIYVAARQLERIEADPRFALLLLLCPGVLADLIRIGPEVLGTTLALVGFLRWRRQAPHAAVPVLCFIAAGLCRETLLLVPAALVLASIIHRAPPRRWLPLLLAPLGWIAWVGVLQLRLGAWPVGMDDGNLRFVPFAGFAEAAPNYSAIQWLTAVTVILAAAVAVGTTQERFLRAVVAINLGLAAILGWFVWGEWTGVGRLLLPLTVFAGLALAERFLPRSTASGTDGVDAKPRVLDDIDRHQATAGVHSS